MSAVSSPAHRLSGDFEGANIYDPNFTAEISNKMRVPHKLLVTGEGKNSGGNKLILEFQDGPEKVSMRVPERIVVAGHDRHVGQKAPPRELRLEQVISKPQTEFIRVETPPRVLSLEDHIFPTVNDEEDDSPKSIKLNDEKAVVPLDDNLNKNLESPVGMNSLDTSLSPTGELLMLRRQLIKLNRRVLLLEHEAQIRQQRDMVIYSIGIAYFVIKTLMWLNRHW